MIQIKSAHEIELMREAGRIAAQCMLEIRAHIKPGVTTMQLDIIAAEFIASKGAVPSFKDYRGFPGNICCSVNEEVVHGIPSKSKMLQDGDIISIDMGAYYKGYHSDMARTFPVGTISDQAEELIRITKECFYAGMEQARVGNRLNDISSNIEKAAIGNGYSVVRELVGHGIGKKLHEPPDIPNFSFRGANPRLRAGMVLAIEPMVNTGGGDVVFESDGWLVRTRDRKLSAHYENTVHVTEEGPRILTMP
ncbi:MAG: type I methionyl aminopeptidase [Christensenellaceae bacterium]|jgi:methionyl aminopeptidase